MEVELTTLLGLVRRRWEISGRPWWDLDRTIRETELADQELASRGLNPAPAFRAGRRRRDHDYMRKWTVGCKFPWLSLR
jgi:hypothetical protein